MDTLTLDVRGLACPQPAMATRRLLQQVSKGTVTVLLDSAAARDNVSRMAHQAGWQVAEKPAPDGLVLVLTK